MATEVNIYIDALVGKARKHAEDAEYYAMTAGVRSSAVRSNDHGCESLMRAGWRNCWAAQEMAMHHASSAQACRSSASSLVFISGSDVARRKADQIDEFVERAQRAQRHAMTCLMRVDRFLGELGVKQ